MIKRQYKLADVKDYLKDYYDLDWKLFYVKDCFTHEERGVKALDFNDKYHTKLSVLAIVYKGTGRKMIQLYVDNESLLINGLPQPRVKWKDFYTKRHTKLQEKNM